MSGWAAGLGDALTTAGKGVIGWGEEKRRIEQEALLRALQQQRLDEGTQRMRFAGEDQERQNADFKNKAAQSLLLDIPGQQMATPGQEQAVRGSIYEGQLSPNRLRNVSTIGGMTMPGGDEPMQGVSASQREEGPQNGSLMTPLVNPQVRIAELNNRTRNETAADRMEFLYTQLGQRGQQAGDLLDLRGRLADQSAQRERDTVAWRGQTLQHQRDVDDLRERIAGMQTAAAQGNAQAGLYARLYSTAVRELAADPTAAMDPAFATKVEARVQEMLKNQPQQAPIAPVASHAPTGGAAAPKSRFNIVSVK